MYALFGAGSAAVGGAVGSSPFFQACWRYAATFALGLGLCGCVQAAPALIGSDPADPAAKTPPVGYRSAIAPYQPSRPADPAGWSEQNQRVAPASQSDRKE